MIKQQKRGKVMSGKTRLEYHVVLCTKYRRKVLDGDIALKTKEAIVFAFNKLNVQVLEINDEDGDHVHILIAVKPTQTISKIIQYVKQVSTWMVWKEYSPILRKSYRYQNILWGDGYFCDTVGQNKEAISKYIQKQNSHSSDT